VSKAAVYRRWPDRQRLVLAELHRRLGRVETPDTGCTLCDLNESLELFARTFRCMGPEFFGPLLADCSADPDLRRTFMDTLFGPPRLSAPGRWPRPLPVPTALTALVALGRRTP
jgi:AcrR family transcriptional regulator